MIRMKGNHISEDRFVDFTLGHLSEEEALGIERHLFTCDQCFEEWQGWQDVLRNDEEERAPSPYLKQKIMNSAENHDNKRKLPFMQKPAYAVISVCILFIMWLTIHPLTSQEDHLVHQEKSDSRTVHSYPVDQKEGIMKVSDLDQFNTLPATYYPNVIWIHNIENRPIVYVNDQGPEQLLDCQYIVVFNKQDWDHPTLIMGHESELYLKEKEDIYLRCVR